MFLQKRIAFLTVLLLATGFLFTALAQAPSAPLTLLHQTALPKIVGDFDHFAVDLKRHHLFVTAEKHSSVEMFDLNSGEHLRSIPGFKTPHAMAYVPGKDELLVADGGESALVIMSAAELEIVKRIPLIKATVPDCTDSPDAAFYDDATHLYYIGNGGECAGTADSKISIFSVDGNKLVGDISVPANNVESIGVDDAHRRLYVNLRDQQKIGVVDLTTNKLIDTWKTPDLKGNTALLFNREDGQIFVTGRKPGIFYVFDLQGKVLTQLPCTENNDDMMWDPALKRVYISGSQGLSVFHQDSAAQYQEITRIPTNGGKTSIFVPQVHKYFVIHPKTDVDTAGLLVYQVNP